MGDAINILGSIRQPDFVSPLEAALRLHESRQNEKTQRMFAENQMMRQSAQDLRDQRDHEEKVAELKRAHDIEAASAVGRVGDLVRMGRAGEAAALGSVYGIDVHPLLATTAAAHAPTPTGDAVDQFLASPEAAPLSDAPAPAVPSPPAGAGAPPMAPLEGPEQDPAMEAARPFMAPAPPPEAPPGAAGGAPSPELEALMTRGMPAPKTEGAKFEAPTNPLYEAVLGGQHFQLGGPQAGETLGGKYDTLAQALIARGAHPMDAYKAALGEKEKDDAAAAVTARAMSGIEARNAETEKLKDRYSLTAEQRLSENEKNRQNAQTVARLRAAMQGGTNSPADMQKLATLLKMAEGGANVGEVGQAAAELKLNPKIWQGPVAQVDRQANADTRTAERRAGLEATDAEGNPIGSGVYKNQQAAAAGNKSEAAFAQLDERLRALIENVRQQGNRVLSPDEIQKRNSLFSAYTAAARVYNGLGGTDASQRLEHEIASAAGTPGNGFLMGANPGVLDHLLQEARDQHRARQKIYVRGGNQALPSAITHKPPVADGLNDAQKKALEAQGAGWRVAD